MILFYQYKPHTLFLKVQDKQYFQEYVHNQYSLILLFDYEVLYLQYNISILLILIIMRLPIDNKL